MKPTQQQSAPNPFTQVISTPAGLKAYAADAAREQARHEEARLKGEQFNTPFCKEGEVSLQPHAGGITFRPHGLRPEAFTVFAPRETPFFGPKTLVVLAPTKTTWVEVGNATLSGDARSYHVRLDREGNRPGKLILMPRFGDYVVECHAPGRRHSGRIKGGAFRKHQKPPRGPFGPPVPARPAPQAIPAPASTCVALPLWATRGALMFLQRVGGKIICADGRSIPAATLLKG